MREMTDQRIDIYRQDCWSSCIPGVDSVRDNIYKSPRYEQERDAGVPTEHKCRICRYPGDSKNVQAETSLTVERDRPGCSCVTISEIRKSCYASC